MQIVMLKLQGLEGTKSLAALDPKTLTISNFRPRKNNHTGWRSGEEMFGEDLSNISEQQCRLGDLGTGCEAPPSAVLLTSVLSMVEAQFISPILGQRPGSVITYRIPYGETQRRASTFVVGQYANTIYSLGTSWLPSHARRSVGFTPRAYMTIII